MQPVMRIAAAGVVGAALVAVGVGIAPMLGSPGSLFKSHKVKLVPAAAGNLLEVDKANRCKKGGHKGCLLFDEDEAGFIRFHLPGSKSSVKTCADPGTNRVITKIRLTSKSKNNDPLDEKGDFSPAAFPVADWLKDEAFPAVTKADGYIYNETPATGETHVKLTNINDHHVSEGTKSYWYQVTVSDCQQTSVGGVMVYKTWTTDPRGDNIGKN